MANETDVKNNKLCCTEDRGSRSVWNDGIHLSKYTESHTGRQKTLGVLAALHDISSAEGISEEKFYCEIAVFYATVTFKPSSFIRCVGNDS